MRIGLHVFLATFLASLVVTATTLPLLRQAALRALAADRSPAGPVLPVLPATGALFLIHLAVVVIFSLLAFWRAMALMGPVRSLSEGARRIAEGETDVVIMERPGTDEIGVLCRTFNRMSRRLHRKSLELQASRRKIEQANRLLREQNQELQNANQALEELSLTDALTKLKNHRFFQEHLRREAACAERSSEPLVLVLIDIDHFKRFNDRYGHAAGDTILEGVADVMRGLVRETDILARYGGEEFGLVPRQAPLAATARLAEKIRREIAATRFEVEVDGVPVKASVTVSIGVASFKGDRRAIFNDADRALYRAKEAGRNCVVVDGEDL